MMKRGYSVDNVLNAKFNTLEFEGKWRDALGCPELAGSWFVYGDVKMGKTSFTMQLVKYLTQFERVLYNSVEEGLSGSIKAVYKREGLRDVRGKVVLISEDNPEALRKRLLQHKSPNIVVVDTVQYSEMTVQDYKLMKKQFPKKLFIYVSHVGDNKKPEGAAAKKMFQFSSIAIRIEGFKAFPTGRYGGGDSYVINEERAERYWGLRLNNDE